MSNENQKSSDKYSKLAGNTLIFAISSFSSKLLTLIVQPFLTYAMAEISDLGLAKILSQYANLLIPFVSMGMSNAIIRFGLDKGNSEKQVFTNGLLTILGGFGILVLCWPVAQFLPDMAQYGLLIYIYVLMSCLRTLCTQFVRSRQWNKLVAVDGVLCTVATMAFYVLYLVGFKWGANGYLLAIISGDLSSVLFLMFTGKLWNYVELKGINKDLWKQMLRFSLPMIPAQISFWIINASDLFFVREMCNGLHGRDGNAWSGLLSTGYFLPTILTTLGLIFYDAWHPYTWALLQALPQLGTKGEALPTIDGTPPNLFNEIKGDAFAPRNKHALAIDFVAEPPFFQVSETHAAKTWYLDPRAPKIERPHSIQNLREKMGKMGGSNLNG